MGDNMKLGSRRTFLGATTMAVVCLLGVAMEAGQSAPAQDRPPMVEEVFKSVMMLKGIPVDTFFETMGMFANAGQRLHVLPFLPGPQQGHGDGDAQNSGAPMIVMMNTINKTYFAGQPRVTCYVTANQAPGAIRISRQHGPPLEDQMLRFSVRPRSQPSSDSTSRRSVVPSGWPLTSLLAGTISSIRRFRRCWSRYSLES
jgi:hypothetical protein